jgi:hypothetical protein
VRTFDKLADLKLARALEDAYCTLPPMEEDKESLYAFYVKYPIRLDIPNQDFV